MASPNPKRLKCNVSDIEESKASTVQGVIVKLSPVKLAKSGSRYFDGEPSDGKGKKCFVSFEPRLRSSFAKFHESKESVAFVNCDVKKSFLSNNELEIIASTSTKVEKCEDEFQISVNPPPPNDAPELIELEEVKNLSANQKVSVISKVMSMEDTESVKHGNGQSVLKRDCIFGDASCSIRLVLWECDVDRLSVGKCYKLVNACVRLWKDIHYILLSGDAHVELVDDIGDVCGDLVSSSNLKEIRSEVVAVHSVNLYFACCLCGGKVVYEEDAVVCTCVKCSAAMKIARCKRKAVLEFSIVDGSNFKVKAFSESLTPMLTIDAK